MASSNTDLPSSTPIDNIGWYANRSKTDFHCVATASKTFKRADGTWLVEAATPTSGEELAQKLVDVIKAESASTLTKLARGETPLESLKAHLSASLAEAMQAWWRDPPEHGIFRKEYQSDPADAATGSVKTSRTKPAVIMLGNTTTGEEEEGEESDTVVPMLTVEVQGMRRYEYRWRGAIFASVRPVGHCIKVGLEGTVVSTTGDQGMTLTFPTDNQDPRYEIYRAILNDSIKRTSRARDPALPSGPLRPESLKEFSDTLLRVVTSDPDEVSAEINTAVYNARFDFNGGKKLYGLDLSLYRPLSGTENTRYSAHGFSPAPVLSPPTLWCPGSGELVIKDERRTWILKFSGCLVSRAASPSPSTSEANELPHESLLSAAANTVVDEMNMKLRRVARSEGERASAQRASWQHPDYKQEKMLAGISAYLFREARSDQLRDIEKDSSVITACADKSLQLDVPTSFEVHMTPLRHATASSSTKSS